ncbi:DUF4365 domain-containing protein [Pseudomonas sp. 91RF]|jgi:hypothetical protein|uniref:DUF4365 domain-containing protein n=1 Tax=Pseudomonas sp. 91RF TaxID=2292261 RepID=UPI000E67481C|nr:DUF4365 domain-containing protein [Pseudomonas sp. 91RF]RIJ09706.1 DUF4365 domain-containing protein [Pseudomonas sp. 91RF]
MSDSWLPDRHSSHIVDTQAKNILRITLPQEWLLRELSENDYGIDFQLEFVSSENKIIGQIAAIQLKGTASSKLNGDDGRHNIAVRTKTLQMWIGYEVPVFLILVDVSARLAYVKSIEHETRKTPFIYKRTDIEKVAFTYSSYDQLEPSDLPRQYAYAKRLRLLDRELPSLPSLHKDFHRLFDERYGRDGHMPVDGDGPYDPSRTHGEHKYERQIRSLYDRIHRLSNLLAAEWDVPTIDEIVNNSAWYSKWGSEMYEAQFSVAMRHLDAKLQQVYVKLRELIACYREHWMHLAPELVSFADSALPALTELTWQERKAVFKDLL